jgi:hypothetical protein
MKTAISIPDELFRKAERLASQLGTSRSQLYSRAIADYLTRHAAGEVTERMNKVCDELTDWSDEFVAAAARNTLERGEWS